VHLKWDGRGGVSIIDAIVFWIENDAVEKVFRQLMTFKNHQGHRCEAIGLVDKNGQLQIPTMYTKAILDLANNMNFKALAALPFEEKYPIERINNCVATVEKYFINAISPFFEAHKMPVVTYEYLYKTIETAKNVEDILVFQIVLLKLYAQKLGLPLPAKLQDYTDYISEMKAMYSDNFKINFDALDADLAYYRF
jgi:hypothetical protein